MSGPTHSELQTQIQTRLLEELNHRQREFQTLINLLEEIVFRCDRAGTIQLLNPSWASKLGFPLEQSIGSLITDYIVSPEQRDQLREALAADQAITQSLKLGTGFGESRSFMLRARLDAGAWYGSLIDVTDQQLTLRALRDSEQRARKLSMVAENTDNMVIITDASGSIDWVNAGFEKATGYQLREVQGNRPGEILQGPDSDPAVVALMRDSVAAGKGFAVEIVNYDKAGKPYWVAIDCKPVLGRDGRPDSFIAIERDITITKQAESAMREARDEAQNLSRARTRFVANMSHEIRTPLNAILGMSSLLDDTALNGAQRTYLHTIQNSGKALLALVNDVLDFAKLESGQLRFEAVSCPIAQPLEEAVDIVAPILREKGLSLHMMFDGPLPRRVVCDPDRLRQVVLNLLSNAAKFTQRGGIGLRCRWIGAETGLLSVDVTDSGIGIDPGRLDSLFDEFTQADPSITREFGGTGLGLAICRQICEQMGGRIWACSREGQGSRFSFQLRLNAEPVEPVLQSDWQLEYSGLDSATEAVMASVSHYYQIPAVRRSSPPGPTPVLTVQDAGRALPLDLDELDEIFTPRRIHEMARAAVNPAMTATIPAPENDRVGHGLRILIAEDVVANQMVLKLMLEKLGCDDVTVVDDGSQAVEQARMENFDLIFTDMHMPVMGGVEAASAIRSLAMARQPLIVAVSADATSEARGLAADAGIDRWISKPVVRRELREVLSSCQAALDCWGSPRRTSPAQVRSTL